MDWKALLKKYMDLVRSEESVTYVYSYLEKESGCTPEEWAALVAMDAELLAEHKAAHEACWVKSMGPAGKDQDLPLPVVEGLLRQVERWEDENLCRSCGGARVCMSATCMDDFYHACHHCGGSGTEK